jgi:SAM-dependent methyltransferase
MTSPTPKDTSQLAQNGGLLMASSTFDSNQSENQYLEKTLRRAYDDFKTTPLARNWPIEENNRVEFAFRVKIFGMAVPFLSRPQGVVLDVGTGAGIAARFFKLLGCRVLSVDFESASGTEAIENVRLAGVEGYACDIEREGLPATTGCIDVVVFTDVIEHLHHSPKPALEEMMRVLRPGGVVIATTPNALRLTVRLKVLLGASNWPKIWDYFDRPGSHFGHHHEYTIEEFKGVFEKSGFVVEQFCLDESNSLTASFAGLGDLQTGIRAGSAAGRSKFYLVRRMIWLCAAMFPRLRSTMTVVARKPSAITK